METNGKIDDSNVTNTCSFISRFYIEQHITGQTLGYAVAKAARKNEKEKRRDKPVSCYPTNASQEGMICIVTLINTDNVELRVIFFIKAAFLFFLINQVEEAQLGMSGLNS